MNMYSTNYAIVLFCYVQFCWSFEIANKSMKFTQEVHGQGRGVVYPPSTVIQFSLGLAVPAQVPNRSIFTNLGTINNVPLPSKLSQFYSPVRTKRVIQKFTHQDFFCVLENIFDSWSFKSIVSSREPRRDSAKQSSKDCVLRSICQISSLQFKLNNRPELILRILQFLFLPSKAGYVNTNSSYSWAEHYGMRLSTKGCLEAYPSCPLSPLEMFFQMN